MRRHEYGLIVPDVHERIDVLEDILERYEDTCWRVFLGDFLDSFEGLTPRTHRMCDWLSKNVADPKNTFLWGNHDIHYAFPDPKLMCSGYTREKQAVVNSYLDYSHWKHFRLFSWAEDWLCSHAGIHPRLLHPVYGYDKDRLREREKRVLTDVQYGVVDDWLAAGQSRGGSAIVGGVTWLDWHEFVPVPGLNQIVGHTPGAMVRSKENGDTSKNYCLDTNSKHVILFVEHMPRIVGCG